MTRSTFSLALIGFGLLMSLQAASANGPGMASMPAPRTRSTPAVPHYRTPPPVQYHQPHYAPPHYRYLPPAVVAVSPPSASVSYGGGVVTSGAWVGYNTMTGRYSVAFDSPGGSGMGTLIQAGYTVMVLGPTTWDGATGYLKSVGAPGW